MLLLEGIAVMLLSAYVVDGWFQQSSPYKIGKGNRLKCPHRVGFVNEGTLINRALVSIEGKDPVELRETMYGWIWIKT